jgi:hypothetical protein
VVLTGIPEHHNGWRRDLIEPHRVIFHLAEPDQFGIILNEIRNLFKDPGIGSVIVEVMANRDGVNAIKQKGPICRRPVSSPEKGSGLRLLQQHADPSPVPVGSHALCHAGAPGVGESVKRKGDGMPISVYEWREKSSLSVLSAAGRAIHWPKTGLMWIRPDWQGGRKCAS